MKGKKAVKDDAVLPGNSTRCGASVTSLHAKAGKKSKQKPSSSEAGARIQALRPTHQQIAERARAIWLGRGCVAGEDEHNWLDAEAQLRHEMGIE
ncbi:MAG: DUF2934 domain-containing protein [Phycisphaerales bacterium]|nr:MAG: DUF2934 domain-containing protein [Phycisphaerales bacterium]